MGNICQDGPGGGVESQTEPRVQPGRCRPRLEAAGRALPVPQHRRLQTPPTGLRYARVTGCSSPAVGARAVYQLRKSIRLIQIYTLTALLLICQN